MLLIPTASPAPKKPTTLDMLSDGDRATYHLARQCAVKLFDPMCEGNPWMELTRHNVPTFLDAFSAKHSEVYYDVYCLAAWGHLGTKFGQAIVQAIEEENDESYEQESAPEWANERWIADQKDEYTSPFDY